MFLPHPTVWARYQEERKIKISRGTAIEFLNSYKSFGLPVIAAFDEWIGDITAIAMGE